MDFWTAFFNFLVLFDVWWSCYEILLIFFYFCLFQVDKLLDQLQQYISSYDLVSLRDYWARLNTRHFSRLDQRYMAGVRKMEVGLLKFYLVFAAQNNKHDKVMEFFEKMTPELQSQSEFREWFSKLNLIIVTNNNSILNVNIFAW